MIIGRAGAAGHSNEAIKAAGNDGNQVGFTGLIEDIGGVIAKIDPIEFTDTACLTTPKLSTGGYDSTLLRLLQQNPAFQ